MRTIKTSRLNHRRSCPGNKNVAPSWRPKGGTTRYWETYCQVAVCQTYTTITSHLISKSGWSGDRVWKFWFSKAWTISVLWRFQVSCWLNCIASRRSARA